MDQIREFFYWTASIAFILISLFVLGLVALLVYVKRLADHGMRKLDASLTQVQDATRTWRNLGVARFIIRAIRLLI